MDVHEGHPFSVEAAVSLGGAKAKPGVSVYRYANRIPLLFEGSNDVVSVVANTRIKSVMQINMRSMLSLRSICVAILRHSHGTFFFASFIFLFSVQMGFLQVEQQDG